MKTSNRPLPEGTVNLWEEFAEANALLAELSDEINEALDAREAPPPEKLKALRCAVLEASEAYERLALNIKGLDPSLDKALAEGRAAFAHRMENAKEILLIFGIAVH